MRPTKKPSMETGQPPVENYVTIQARMDRRYESEWWKWVSSLSPGERAGLVAMKMIKPVVERPRKHGSATMRDEQDAQTRFEETASHSITPDAEICAAEIADELDADEWAEIVRQRLRNRHFHFFAMFIGTGVEQFNLLKLRSMIMLRHAAPRLLDRFGLIKGAVSIEMRRLRSSVGWYDGYDYIPLGDVLSSAAEEDETEAAAALHLDVRAWRLLRFGEFCEEIAEDSRTLDAFAKNAAAWLRRSKPKEIAGLGNGQIDHSRKFGEKWATTSAREKRVVEAPMIEAGMKGYHGLGGTKTDAHRKACSEAQKGNTNRRDGEARRRDHCGN